MSLDILFVCFLTAPLNVHDFSSLISLDLVDNYPPNRNIKTFSKHNRRLRFVSRILQGMGENCIHFLVLIRVMPPYQLIFVYPDIFPTRTIVYPAKRPQTTVIRTNVTQTHVGVPHTCILFK